MHQGTLGLEQLCKAVAEGRLSAVPHVKWAGWICRHKLEQHTVVWPQRLMTKVLRLPEDLCDDCRFGCGLQPKIHKTRTCHLGCDKPLLERC